MVKQKNLVKWKTWLTEKMVKGKNQLNRNMVKWKKWLNRKIS